MARLEWLRDDTFALVDGLEPPELTLKPTKGRPIDRILSHILGADYSYLSAGGLKVPGLHALYAAADRGEGDARHILREATRVSFARLNAMTAEERERLVEKSTGAWTCRRMLRRLLEHNWEHYREVEERLGSGPAVRDGRLA
ncbi:MAG: DinB family protein [Chloroflexi bacterium]|nr:DinB family protein [Chloroflexota bacterium]